MEIYVVSFTISTITFLSATYRKITSSRSPCMVYGQCGVLCVLVCGLSHSLRISLVFDVYDIRRAGIHLDGTTVH